MIASFIQEYVHCWRIDQRNKPFVFKPPPPPKPYVQVVPEGYESTGQYTYKFIGAPDHFKPDMEPIASILKRKLGMELFQKQCWDPKFLERMEKGDEVRRHIMWLFGRYETNSTAEYQRNYTEGLYWLFKQEGEDFVTWYNRHEREQQKKLDDFWNEYHKKYIKPVMDKYKDRPDFVAVETRTDGSQCKHIYKDGKVTIKEM